MPPATPDAPSSTRPDGVSTLPDVVSPAGSPAVPDDAADATGGTWATRAHTGVVGDDAMTAATGHPRTHWFTLLDEQGATAWRHRDIAAWLVGTHGVDAWWAQGITVGYEQERGIRVPGQRQDGSFEASTSRTLPLDVAAAYRLVAEPGARQRWLDVPVDVTGETADASVRWTMPDGSRVVCRVQPVRDGAARVVVQHARLADADAVVGSKKIWGERLDRLAALAREG